MAPRLLGIFKRRGPELDCDQVQEISSDFIDEDLDGDAKRKVVAHLGWCPPCTAFINTLRATVGLLRATPAEAPPADFKERLRDSIRRERAR
jgi:predicted anti-sigma-YlaC factor YlaD